MIETGMIGLEKGYGGWFNPLIQFFTGHGFKKSQLTHSFITIQDVYGEPTVLEAKERVHVVPFDKFYRKGETSWVVYKVKAPKTALLNAAKLCYQDLAGDLYGFTQILWFPYRWLMAAIGVDVTHQKNWMTAGTICSEVCYWFLFHLGGEFQKLVAKYNPDTINAQDVLEAMQSRPDLFELAEIQAKDEDFNKAVRL